ncbi:MAG: hypothetical protein DWI29_04655 [Planctomycetota bacterium]|nr:MAG: hypothetical protein DWI29_04655 [Planctomycetota bacterium]
MTECRFLLYLRPDFVSIGTAHRNWNSHTDARQYAHKLCGQFLPFGWRVTCSTFTIVLRSEIPVTLIGGFSETRMHELLRFRCVSSLLEKPFTPTALVNAISAAVSRSIDSVPS